MLPSFKGVITPDLLIVAMDLLLLRKVTEARDAFAGLREIFQRYLFGYLILLPRHRHPRGRRRELFAAAGRHPHRVQGQHRGRRPQ